MAEPAPAPRPQPLPLTLIDQAFVNLCISLTIFSVDREDRQFMTEVCRDLLPLVSRAHPQMGPVVEAFERLDAARGANLSFAATAMGRVLSSFTRWRGLQACAEAQRRGILPPEGPWTS